MFFLISGLMAAALALSGCAHTMKTNAALEDAQAVYRTAQENPDVARNAPLELKKAETALNKAEQLFQQKGETEEIEHQAYLAKQHVYISEEIGKQKMAEAALEQAGAERNKVILEARTREAKLAEQNASKEKAAALNAVEEAKAQRATAESAMAETKAQKAAAESAMAEAKAQKATAESAMEEAKAQKATAESAMANAAAANDKSSKLEQEIAKLKAIKADRGLVITLGDVVFDVNKADLKAGGVSALGKLEAFLKEYPTRRVMVEGFTDSTGELEYNQALSERRALAVRQVLQNNGIESARIDFKGYGEDFPVATNETMAGRQMNRRVEIIISDEAGVIPARTK
jgi:outer membrane protein OmpA-like peptidoglycan-associated protein